MDFDLKDLEKLFKPKGILGRGIGFKDKKLRVVNCMPQNEKIRVMSMKELELPEKPEAQLEFLIQAALKSETEVGLSFVHPQMKIKKATIPAATKKDIAQALRWQLYTESKEAAANAQICFHANGIASAKTAEFWVYGLAKSAVFELKQKVESLKLKAAAAEPLPLTLVAWAHTLDPALKKNVGILYFTGKRGDFVGLKEGQFFHWGFFEEEVEEGTSFTPSPSDLGSRFQSLMDEFLLKSDLPQLDEIWIAGDWEEESPSALSSLFAVKCMKMGEGTTQVLFLEEEQKIAYRFAAELGMAVFPRSEL
ncbi:MAG: hypothetical protein HQM15_00110 [Deltaproteobacteria bacterium]|nr:hypothetical protein [Deltaproteobacteria bacterium]